MKLKPLFVLFLALFVVFTAASITRSQRSQKAKNAALHAPANIGNQAFQAYVNSIYNEIGLGQQGMDSTVFFKAMAGYFNLKAEGKLNPEKEIISVADFSKPSVEKRFWVIDLKEKKVLFHTLVAHGRNSGENEAHYFSNLNSSNMSSLGFYVTGERYIGKHGLSLFIDGMDQGFNTAARSRAVVVHGADYVSEEFINNVGRLGRSLGCPALPVNVTSDVVNTIENKTTLFIYFPDKKYENSTHYYNAETAAAEFVHDFQVGMNQ